MTTEGLLDTLERRGREGGDRAACTWRGRALAWRSLLAGVEAVTARLVRLGVQPGDRVLLALAEAEAFLPAFWGTLRAGAVAVPVLPRSGASRLREIAAWLDAAGVVADGEPAARWEALETDAAATGRWCLTGEEATAPGPVGIAPAADAR